jgi:hypothetical protein
MGQVMKKLSTGFIHRLLNTPKNTLNVAMYLRGSVRSMLVGEPLWRIARKRCLVLLAALCVVSTTPANATKAATYSIDHLKLYAHSRLLDYKEFQCLNSIITKESRWSYTARNGSHRGLGQMRSEHYGNLDPYRQIDATIRYVHIRYKTMCKAWAFHQQRNYY